MANKFVPWIDEVEPGTTTQEQSVFAEDSQRVNGFVAGDPASAIRVNSALRQANVVVAALMQLADELETLPDLDLNSSVANIANALKASIITPIETHLSNLDDEVAALSGGSSTLGQRVSTLENEMNAVENKNSQQDTSISNLTSRMGTAETDIGNLSTRIGTAETDIDNLEEEIANLTGGSLTLTNRVSTLESEMDTAQSDINSLETRMTTAEGEIDTLQSDMTSAKSRLDKLEDFYETNVATTGWSGSAGNYTYSIAATTHHRGTRPRVHTYVDGEETYDSPTIDWSTGNVTLHSNAQVAMKVLIY